MSSLIESEISRATDVFRQFLFLNLGNPTGYSEQIINSKNTVKYSRIKKSFWSSKVVLEVSLSNPIISDDIKYISVKFSDGYNTKYNIEEILSILNDQYKSNMLTSMELNKRGSSVEDKLSSNESYLAAMSYKWIIELHKEALKLY